MSQPIHNLASWLGERSFADAWEEYDTEGYILFKNVMAADEVERVRAALTPHFTKLGRNDFEGFKSHRVYALLAKAPDVFSDMVTHPLALAFAERELGPSCLLSALLAINTHPGETPQGWHSDDAQTEVPRPHKAYGVSTFWAIDETTVENGATELVRGSHLWSSEEVMGFHAGTQQAEIVSAVMPAGSLMVAKGTLIHRGGANRSEHDRLIVTPQYCPGWARQLENMVLAVPKETAAALPKRTRELMGYNIHGTFMGYVDGVHPDRLLGHGKDN